MTCRSADLRYTPIHDVVLGWVMVMVQVAEPQPGVAEVPGWGPGVMFVFVMVLWMRWSNAL